MPHHPWPPRDDGLEVAGTADVDALLVLRDELAAWMEASGIDQWHPGELAREKVASWVEAGLVLVRPARHGDAGDVPLLGAIAVLPDDPEFWGATGEDGTAGYVHLLMVRRQAHGRGLGDELLGGAEARIAATGRGLARLDAASDNARLSAWYERRGYRATRRVELPGLGPTTLREKALAPGR